jgi:DnaJ-like protein/uncharacterized protein DUF4388
MNGQLSEHPLCELIREISAKNLSGRLRLQHDRIVVVTYFAEGNFLYAAANVRTLRLREYLLNKGLVFEEDLQRIGEKRSDLELASALVGENKIDAKTVEMLQLRQIADVLRLALLWTDGTWEFDHRSHLNENVDFSLEPQELFLEAARRIPAKFAASRFRNDAEVISLNASSADANKLEPREGFILSRLDRPTPLKELLVLSGLRDDVALGIIYALALAGYVNRETWKNAFRDEVERKPTPPTHKAEAKPFADEVNEFELLNFLARVEGASTHYEVLSLTDEASVLDIKDSYYDLARRYHPDRFRRRADEALNARIESVFARITQAYETLADTSRRAAYDSRLEARRRAQLRK